MGNYYRKRPSARKSGPHPVWSGLGCLLMVVVPVISIALAILVVDMMVAANLPVPYQLLGHPRFPTLVFSTPGLAMIFGAIASVNNLYAYIAVSLLLIMLLGGLVSLLYSILYRLAGPSRYGPLDAPPPKIRAKAYKR